MKYLEIECEECGITYGIEYDQDTATDMSDNDKPVYCPFCSEMNRVVDEDDDDHEE